MPFDLKSSLYCQGCAAFPDHRQVVFAISSALRIDKPRTSYRAVRIDADGCATQIRDNQYRFGVMLVIRFTEHG